MSTSDNPDPEAVLEEAATLWLLEREDGFTPARADAFAAWCNASPLNAAAVERVQQTLSLLSDLPSRREPLEARVPQLPRTTVYAGRQSRTVDFKSWVWIPAMAAAVLLVATMWWNRSQPMAAPETFAAPATEPRRVSLADGSVVDINASGRVDVQFSEDERRLTLGTGEAHFQVAHNSGRPFFVTANGVTVRAVGTAFNVRVVGDQVDVLVTEGKIEIKRERSALFQTTKRPLVPLLAAGERTHVTSNRDAVPAVETLAPEVIHSLLSWQDRMTSFSDVPLREMVARINRCNTRQLVIGDPQLEDRRVGGVINLNQLDAFVHLLEQDGDIVADRSAPGEIVLHRPR